MKLSILFLISLYTVLGTFAQTEKMTFKNLTPSMGLSHGEVLSFCQDHEGYMWIGTMDGLNKYDGIGFTVYKNNKNDTSALSDGHIYCIYEDKQNNLWIGLSNGLCRYNRDENNFEKISYNDDQNKKFESIVNAILEDNAGRLWIGTSTGIFWLDKKNKLFRSCFTDIYGKDVLTFFNEIHQDKNGILWFASRNLLQGGIIKYNPLTKETDRYNTRHPVIKLLENPVNSFIIDNH